MSDAANFEIWKQFQEKRSNHLLTVMNYAEWDKGLDPIGASDMLTDLARFTYNMMHENVFLPPEETWEQFTQSDAWKQYGLNNF